MFQSTPPVAEGRCLAEFGQPITIRTFQSTPPVAEGRCLIVEGERRFLKALFQSTPPVAEGRCEISLTTKA